MRRALLLLAGALAIGPAARANDSVAEAAAGGLVLVQSRDIDMVSEDLYVSRLDVRVRYVFRNRAAHDVRVTVAFPMPDRDLATEEGEIAWPADFSTRVAGRRVAMQVERRAMLGSVDHSALLHRLGVPIAGRDDDDRLRAALDALPRAAQDRLESLHLANFFGEPGTDRRSGEPLWTVKETWHWDQVFPAGRDLVVEHRYRPGLGGTVATALGSPEIRAGDYGRGMIARYCIDRDLLATIDRARRPDQGGYVPYAEAGLGYVLTTGANWRAPIGSFRLVVDKGDPRALISFCGQDVRRIGPTRFEMRRTNWRPTRDLDILFLLPLEGGGD